MATRRVAFVLLLLGAASIGIWTLRGAEPDGPSTIGAPASVPLQLTPGAVDFGRVRVGESVEEMLIATNVGDTLVEGTVTIDAPFRASRHALKLGPNESREVLVGLSPREPGQLHGSLRFARAGAGTPELVVPLAAIAHLPGRAQVAPLILRFGAVELGQTVQSEFEIRNQGEDVLRITGLGLVAPFSLPGEPSDELELAPGAELLVTVEFSPTRPGSHRTELLLRTSDPDEPQFQITLMGEGSATSLYPQAEVSREALDFGEVMVGRARDLSIQVRNAGADPLQLSRVVVAAPFSVPPRSREIAPGRAYLLPVTYSPTSFGRSEARLRIFTNDPEHSQLEVALFGLGSSAGGGRALGGPGPAVGGTLLDGSGSLPPDSPLRDPSFDPEPVDDGMVAIGTYDAEITSDHVGDVLFDAAARSLQIRELQLPDVLAPGDQRFTFDPVDAQLSVDANGEISGRVAVLVRNSLGNDERLWIDLTTAEMTVQTPSGSLAVQGKPLGTDGKATLVGQVPGGYLHHNMEVVLHLTARGVDP